jgi:hypothetical protein
MQRKIVGILVGMLLIAAAVLPVAGTMNEIKNKTVSSTQLSDPEWSRTYGGSEADKFWDVAETDDGGCIAIGTTEESNNHYPWVVKVDSDGNEMWNWSITEFTVDGEVLEITYCWQTNVFQISDGGYIVSLTALETNYNDEQYEFGCIAKLSSEGDEEWINIQGDGFEWTIRNEYLLEVEDGFLGVGDNMSPPQDIYGMDTSGCLFKINNNGELEWYKEYNYGEFVDKLNGIYVTDDGFLLVGLVGIVAELYYDGWLVKTDSQGEKEWEKTFGGPNNDVFWGLTQTDNGDCMIVGWTSSYGAGSNDAWLLRTDGNGNEVWNKTFGEKKYDSSYDYVFDTTNDGGCIIPVTINSGGITGNKTDSWVINANGDGIVEWKHIYGGPEHQYFNGICSTSDGGCIASGISGGWDSSKSDALLVKYAAYGENNAPNAPIITGETSGTAGKEYQYTFNAVDPDGGDVYYWVQWDDGCPSVEWIGPFPSGVDVKLNHTFANQGTFTIGAKARDVFDAESDWGELTVTMPRNRAMTNLLFLRFLEQFPILRLLLQR